MHTKFKKKSFQQKEEFHSTTLQEALTRVDMEDSKEVKDVEDLVEEA
jgi:hypothetical protein